MKTLIDFEMENILDYKSIHNSLITYCYMVSLRESMDEDDFKRRFPNHDDDKTINRVYENYRDHTKEFEEMIYHNPSLILHEPYCFIISHVRSRYEKEQLSCAVGQPSASSGPKRI